MFYRIIKLLARFSLLFFFKRKIICGTSLYHLKGPAVIAANHPNSMIDAAFIACLCKQKVHFTIRSDMFNNPLFRFLLKFLNGIPIYRSTEEKDKLKKNFGSIEQCRDLLKEGAIVIVFSEGITEHEWKLKPLKSATARIVQYALLDNELTDTLRVIPVGLTYSNYNRLAKTMVLQAGESFYPGKLPHPEYTGAWKQAFNSKLFDALHTLIPELEIQNEVSQNLWQGIITNTPFHNNCQKFTQHLSRQAKQLSFTDLPSNTITTSGHDFWTLDRNTFLKNTFSALLFALPALTGLVLNILFFLPTQIFSKSKTAGTIFYDSLLIGLFTVLYPLYIITAAILLTQILGLYFLLWVLLIPLSGWCSIQAWILVIKMKNYYACSPEQREYLKGLISCD